VQWVQTKEKEGCVFWYKPDRDLRQMSKFFEEKLDPVNEQPYQPLLLDPWWWRVRFNRTGATSARYVANAGVVISNICDVWNNQSKRNIDIPALQELVHQSNPTLEPISKWPCAPSMRFLPRPNLQAKQDFAGHDSIFKGYINQEDRVLAGSTLPYVAIEQTRISNWPGPQRDRFDNLHSRWQKEEHSSARRNVVFSLSARSTMGDRDGSMSARGVSFTGMRATR